MIAQVRRVPLPPLGAVQRFVSSSATRPSSYNPERRTAEAVLATAHPVRRRDHIEVLKVTPDAVDLTRVSQGACKILDSHRHDSVTAIAGTVEACWFEQGQLLGRLRFADNATGREIEQGIADCHLSSVSVGYSRLQLKIKEQGKRPEDDVVEVVRWALLELSVVAAPADPDARIRHHEPLRYALTEARAPALEDDITALRLAVFEADERHVELLDQWYDHTEASGLRPGNEEVEAAEDVLDAAKARLERAERRERAIKQAMKR